MLSVFLRDVFCSAFLRRYFFATIITRACAERAPRRMPELRGFNALLSYPLCRMYVSYACPVNLYARLICTHSESFSSLPFPPVSFSCAVNLSTRSVRTTYRFCRRRFRLYRSVLPRACVYLYRRAPAFILQRRTRKRKE